MLFGAWCTSAIADNDENTLICIERFLRSHELLDESLIETTNRTGKDCKDVIDNFRTAFYSTTEEELRNYDSLREHRTCIVTAMEKLQVAELSMKKVIYENPKQVSSEKRNKIIRAVEQTIDKNRKNAAKICVDSIFTKYFWTMYSIGNKTDRSNLETEQMMYCLSIYMIENNFIDTTVYNVTLNPANIDVTGLDCEKTVKIFVENDEFKGYFSDENGKFSPQMSLCLTAALKLHPFSQICWKVAMLGEIGITGEVAEEEKKIYIERMTEMFKITLDCMKPLPFIDQK